MNTNCSIEQIRVAMLAQKILVVDDDEDLRELLAINLRIAGYECTVVDDCFDIVNFVMDENPNLLIIDLMIPKTDGYEICRRIRVISTIPIIMFTSMTLDQEIRTKAATAGASMVMSKSIDIPDLLAEINSLLQG